MLSGGFSKVHVDLMCETCHWFWFSVSRRLVWSYHVCLHLAVSHADLLEWLWTLMPSFGIAMLSFGFLHLVRLLVLIKFLLLALKFLPSNCLPMDSCE